jgi:hypothetical protein
LDQLAATGQFSKEQIQAAKKKMINMSEDDYQKVIKKANGLAHGVLKESAQK